MQHPEDAANERPARRLVGDGLDEVGRPLHDRLGLRAVAVVTHSSDGLRPGGDREGPLAGLGLVLVGLDLDQYPRLAVPPPFPPHNPLPPATLCALAASLPAHRPAPPLIPPLIPPLPPRRPSLLRRAVPGEASAVDAELAGSPSAAVAIRMPCSTSTRRVRDARSPRASTRHRRRAARLRAGAARSRARAPPWCSRRRAPGARSRPPPA